MTEQTKLFIRNIPDAFPDDKFVEILKKQFENSVNKINIYRHVHKFKNKLNKICFFIVNSEETKQKVYDFFANFELIDQRGLKHKLKVVSTLLPFQNETPPLDKINNSITQLEHYRKFLEYHNNGKLVDFKQEEDKFNQGIFDGVEEKKPEVVETPEKSKVITSTAKTSQPIGKKIIKKPNVEKSQVRDENVENNVVKNEVEVLGEGQGFINQSNYKKDFNTSNYNGKNDNNNSNYYYKNNSYFNNKNFYNNNNYKGNNYNNYDNNNYNNNYNSNYNNNYYNNNERYYENENNYNKRNNKSLQGRKKENRRFIRKIKYYY